MPLTKKGEKIMDAMMEEYGEEKGKRVFHASRNKGKIKGVDKGRRKRRKAHLEEAFFGGSHGGKG